MDPLSLTASVVAVTTAALQSAKLASNLVGGLAGATHNLNQSRSILSQTETTLEALKKTINTHSGSPNGLVSILHEIKLRETLKIIETLCEEFNLSLSKSTSHSTDSRISTRDKLILYFNESKISRLNGCLADCQRTVILVLASITLILSSQSSGNTEQLRDQFTNQERALTDLSENLRSRSQLSAEVEETVAIAAGLPSQAAVTATLQDVCQRALSVTKARRTGQRFGPMTTDKTSIAMQGIVGAAQWGVEQSFDSLTTTNNSRAFQGQMDPESFAKFLGD